MSYTAEEILSYAIFCAGGDTDLFWDSFYPEFSYSLLPYNANFDHMVERKIYCEKVLRLKNQALQEYMNEDPICGFYVNFAPERNFDSEYFTAYMTGKPCPNAELHFKRLNIRCVRFAMRNPDHFLVRFNRAETIKHLSYYPDYLKIAKEQNRLENCKTL